MVYSRRAVIDRTKLTVRVPRDLLENIKRYAAQNNTTITAFIEGYLRRIPRFSLPSSRWISSVPWQNDRTSLAAVGLIMVGFFTRRKL